MIIQVALPQPLRKTFDYLLPSALASQSVAPGMRVKVPWGKQELIGVIMGTSFHSDVPAAKLRPILALLDAEPIIPPALIQFCRWAADYYHHPIGETMALTLPPILRKQSNKTTGKKVEIWQLTEAGKELDITTLKRARKQHEAMRLFQKLVEPDEPPLPQPLPHTGGRGADCAKEHNSSFLKDSTKLTIDQLQEHNINRDTLLKLQQQGWIEKTFIHQIILPTDGESTLDSFAHHEPLLLNDEQQHAVNLIRESLQRFVPFVLDGVTGSGKTEVYLHIIHDVLRNGKQALVLVPEIGLTPQTVARFQHRFPNTNIAIFHSNLTDNERLQQWQQAQRGEARIIIGTRSALFTPLPELGVIIIDEVHDASFKQHEGLRYSARDLALKRGQMAQVPVIMGSATHTLETLLQVKKQRFISLPLTKRAGDAKPPTFQVIDMRKQPIREGLALVTQREIEKHLMAGNQVLLFINRRGFSPVLLCHDCGWTAVCNRCDARMTLHMDPYQLHCHHCDTVTPVTRACPQCRGENVLTVGVGTERIERYLQQVFPQHKTIRIDRDTTRRKNSLENLLDEIHDGTPQILVGTQMSAKGHHFPNVTLVGILNVDQGLCSADFRATEQLAQLVTQVAGRAGRAEKRGHVLLQTHFPDNPLLIRLLREGYGSFAEAALQEREMAHLPPYSAMAIIRAESPKQENTMAFLDNIRDLAISLQLPDFNIMGPMPAIMAKRAGMFRGLLLLQSTHKTQLQLALKQLMPLIESQKKSNNVRWHVDIDPIDTF
jgi:primosomal protein N' (replication factor Y)